MNETQYRDEITRLAKSMFDRGLTFGTSGNISVRLEDGWLMTPTGSTMGDIDPALISKLDDNGRHLTGDKPTKENFLHLAMYEKRPRTSAIVHLHSTHSVAVSCLADLDAENVIPPITAYYVMKIGTLPLVPYYPPGDLNLVRVVREMAGKHHAVLLANHGPIVGGTSLQNAVSATEELEETARLFLMLKGQKTRFLTEGQVKELNAKFPS
jgi:ribulose-5-phosphate 4-epimerase/fuculose-1-phosphate aldolase|tara:strand:- start:322 stop:954 length:633 start_codon:yes stop_codon:yes gene_type:complete